MTACRPVRYFAIVDPPYGRVVAFHESEREHYALRFGQSIVGEYASYATAERAVKLGLKGWRLPVSAQQPDGNSDRHH
jgi:hypothetical protein